MKKAKSENIHVKDNCVPPFFWVYNATLEFISEKVGLNGIGVFCWLCYYAKWSSPRGGKERTCHPSITTLANHCKVSRRKIMRILHSLQEIKAISVDRFQGETNVYTLHEMEDKNTDRKTSIQNDTSDKVDTGVVSKQIPVPVPNQAHELNIIEQDIFNKNEPSAAEAALDKVYKDGLNIYQLINRMRKELGWRNGRSFPDEVLIRVSNRYFKDKGNIKNNWAWFTKVLRLESESYFAQKNIEEHNRFKQQAGALSLKQILKWLGINKRDEDYFTRNIYYRRRV